MKVNSLCKSSGHDWKPTLAAGFQKCSRCPAIQQDPPPMKVEEEAPIEYRPVPAPTVRRTRPDEEDMHEPWTAPKQTRYEECAEGSEERRLRDWLFNWGRDHDFRSIRFQYRAGVPLMTCYPIITSGSASWRYYCHNWYIDTLIAAVKYCEQQEREQVHE